MLFRSRQIQDGEEGWNPDHKLQEKINGNLILSQGKRAKLILEYRGLRIECEGETVQKAANQPLDPIRAEKQMRKTGNTEFQFDRLQVETEGGIFLPMHALNELRRRGIQELTEGILSKCRRKDAEKVGIFQHQDQEQRKTGEIRFSAMVQSQEQLEAASVRSGGVDVIYLDCFMEFREETLKVLRKDQKSCRYFLAMP